MIHRKLFGRECESEVLKKERTRNATTDRRVCDHNYRPPQVVRGESGGGQPHSTTSRNWDAQPSQQMSRSVGGSGCPLPLWTELWIPDTFDRTIPNAASKESEFRVVSRSKHNQES